MMCQPLKPEDCYSMASRTNILINVFFSRFLILPVVLLSLIIVSVMSSLVWKLAEMHV